MPKVFISYSHKDEKWKELMITQLNVLHQEGLLDIWVDTQIGAGEDWYSKITQAIEDASVAVLLISADFLGSNFILKEEVPRLMERREKQGLRIIPVLAEPCAWKKVKWLSKMQLRPRDGRSLLSESGYQTKVDLAAIAEEIANIIETTATAELQKSTTEPKTYISKLPSTSPDLFGRDDELKLLNNAWDNPSTNIVTLVAWGGVGKTSLVNKWLLDMKVNDYRGAEYVYGWSFYSQGAGEGRQTSTDQFIADALTWFGDSEGAKQPDRGRKLAQIISSRKVVLVLDGLEPLQNPPGGHEGHTGGIKDTDLHCLLRELAYNNKGLCVITTRLAVDDVKEYVSTTVVEKNLDHLSLQAGAQLLKKLGVNGTQQELEQTSHDFGGHALALTLLGTYLDLVCGGDIRQRDKIGRLANEPEHGKHAERVMRAYEQWFEGKPELDVLYIMGLFDRPAENDAINALRARRTQKQEGLFSKLFKKAPVEDIFSRLHQLSEIEFNQVLKNLRKVRLLASENTSYLDCHPLVREYFGDALKKSNIAAWKEGHDRLYGYYKSHAKEYPDTIEEMNPLYAAVAHGCLAGKHQEVMDEVYWKRILRGNEKFSIKKLGVFGADLAALWYFFDAPWSVPTVGLRNNYKIFVLSSTGFRFRALGRLREAVQPIQSGLKVAIAKQDWVDVAIYSGNLSELHLVLGDIAKSVEYAQQGVEYAERSGDAFQRMGKHTTLADALHQQGGTDRALELFAQAEAIQNQDTPDYPYLYSLPGFRYCDLLLEQGKYDEVLERAGCTLEWVKRVNWLLDIALDNLSLGRAYMLKSLHHNTGDYSQASSHLDHAVDMLRKAGTQHELPRGLLARAELYRVCGNYDYAQHDLAECMSLATRCGMKLHEADCHLEYARLYAKLGDTVKSHDSLAKAKELIVQTGYHRRDRELSI